jgi:hypothetical protein
VERYILGRKDLYNFKSLKLKRYIRFLKRGKIENSTRLSYKLAKRLFKKDKLSKLIITLNKYT